MKWLELITNPETNRVSTSDTTLIGAWLISSLVLIVMACRGQVDEWLYVGYMAAWVTQNQASKRVALTRTKMEQGE